MTKFICISEHNKSFEFDVNLAGREMPQAGQIFVYNDVRYLIGTVRKVLFEDEYHVILEILPDLEEVDSLEEIFEE